MARQRGIGVRGGGHKRGGRGRGSMGQVADSSRTTRSTSAHNQVVVVESVQTNSPADNSICCAMCNSSSPSLDDSIGCDRCDNWFHPTPACTGLNAQAINSIRECGGEAISFVCCECRSSPSSNSAQRSGNVSPASLQDPATVTQLFELVKSLAQSVAGLTNQVQLLVAQQTALPASVTATDSGTPCSQRESLYAELREFDERKKRRDSLIFKGAKSRNNTEFSNTFAEICSQITGSSSDPDEVYCINSQSGMYRVKVRDESVRRSILQNASKLKDSQNFKQIYISRDMTFIQRQELRAARATRRNPNGEQINTHHDNPVSGSNAVPVAASLIPVTPTVPLQQGTGDQASRAQNL